MSTHRTQRLITYVGIAIFVIGVAFAALFAAIPSAPGSASEVILGYNPPFLVSVLYIIVGGVVAFLGLVITVRFGDPKLYKKIFNF